VSGRFRHAAWRWSDFNRQNWGTTLALIGMQPPTSGAHAMRPSIYRSNPFLMMTDPDSILDAVEHSDRLNHLRRHVCRPLDRPLIPRVRAADLSDFDAAIDLEGETEFDSVVA
jgi:hypothetical protein